MKQNLIIRASAGTGKTFSLATRFIRLMLFEGVSPDRIVALTFSRAAAQEIYMKLLDRLWSAALSDVGAARERETLLKGLDGAARTAVEAAVRDWSPARFAGILRRVIATQHHGTIATLDSFILKIVRSFPLEMGFQNAVDVLDGFGEQQAVADARAELLSGADATGEVAAAFRTATKGEFVRTCAAALGGALSGWRDFLLEHPDCASWTPASMRRALGVAEEPARPDLACLPEKEPFAGVRKALDEFTGTGSVFPKNRAGELMRHLAAHPEATTYAYDTASGRAKTVVCTPRAAAAVRAAARYMLDVKVGRSLDVVAAKLKLCRLIEKTYDAATRRRGLLTFADFTDCQAVAERDAESALKLENLQYRFDARFDHWALDEFQDTSQLQWTCLRRLVREAAAPGAGRSVMAVGDLKQSIYTWRGGNDAPFKEMMDAWPEFRGACGEIVPNDISYRYEKHTVDFINRVFGPENVRAGGVLGADVSLAVDRWLADDCWMTHRPETRNGVEKAGDYVEVVAVPPPDAAADAADAAEEEEPGGAAMKILAPKICACVADLWAAHERAESTETIGVLVRNNKDGLALAERLRAWGGGGLPVVWEGVDGLLDAPVVRAVLELLKLSEHPEDTFAWQTVNTLFPIRARVFPEMDEVSAVSARVAQMLTRLGLARTLREIVSRILAVAPRPDARSVLRLEALVREGVGYERRRDAVQGVLRFRDYLAATAGRESAASPHVIRILTIHRAKGLTLDHVVVPILETGRRDTIVKPRQGQPLAGAGWALDALPEAEAKLVDPVSRAWRAAANERVLEQLRLNYVALTRARRSTHVFVCADDHAGTVQFRDLLTRPFAGEPTRECPYGVRICALGAMPAFGRKPEAEACAEVQPWGHAPGRPRVLRRSPSSEALHEGRGARPTLGALFAATGPSAAEKGIAAHARYAQIEWIDSAAPRDALEAEILAAPWAEAFVRRPETTALWRERAYELFIDGVWETGQFDRVVFSEAAGVRTAVVYDFKTNAPLPDETPAAFARRLRAAYAQQLDGYRRALASLTGIPPERIAARLLLAAGLAVVPMAQEADAP